MCSPSPPLDVTAFNRLQISKIAASDRSCQQLLSGRGVLGPPPLPPSQDPLLHLIVLFPVSLKECFRLDFSLNSALIAFHKFSYAVSSYFPYYDSCWVLDNAAPTTFALVHLSVVGVFCLFLFCFFWDLKYCVVFFWWCFFGEQRSKVYGAIAKW